MRAKTRPRQIRSRVCEFCQKKEAPDYKKHEMLKEYVTDRGKIVGRSRSGVCAKHQRRLTKAIKRARHLALLSFTQRI